MSGLGSYGSGSYYSSSLMAPSMNRRSDRGNYDDRRYPERSEPRSRFSDNYREQSDLGPPRRQSRFSPPPYSGGQRGDRRQDQRSKAVSYPLGHLGHQGSSRSDYDRDDQDLGYSRDRNRSSNRNRNSGMRGGVSLNEGPGILGAKPGAQPPQMPPDLTSPLQGLGLSSLSPDGLRAQIAQQQQQLMAMVQTQSLLAAVQAQANSQVNQRPPPFNPAGLLPTPPMPPERRNHPQQMRKRRNDSPMQGGNYGKRDRQSYDNRNRNQQGYNNRRGNQWGQRQNRRPQQQQRKATSPQSRSAPETKEDKSSNDVRGDAVKKADKAEEENESEVPEGVKEKPEHDQDAKEVSTDDKKEPPQAAELPSTINFLGQDVDAVVKSLFNTVKQQYICTDCKIICNKASSFRQHLLGKRHSKTILENSGKELDLDEWKKFQDKDQAQEQAEKPAPLEEKTEESAVATVTPTQDVPPSPMLSQSDEECDFVKYTCDTRKMAVKNDDLITISSITEARVRITGFTSGRNMYGCEFVKAVAGFNCRLCKTFIRYGNDVTSHIRGKKHQRNYELYIQEHPQYVENQLSRNKELELILEKREGEEVVLYEVLDEDVKKPRRRRRDSLGAEQTEVPITKFVIAPSAEDKAVHELPCGEAESVEDEVIESLLQDPAEAYGCILEEDEEELKHDTAVEQFEREHLLLQEDEKNAVDDDVKENEKEPEVKVEEDEEEPLVTSPIRRVSEVESGDSQSQEQKAPVGTSRRAGKTIKVDPKLESGDSESQEEKQSPSPSPRRGGRRGGRGGRAGGRGRGRGRGSRRSTRNTVPQGSVERENVTTKDEEQAADADTEDMSFMDGFEVIDEIAEED